MIYVLFFSCLYFSSLIETSTTIVSNKYKRNNYFFIFCCFVFVAGFRYKTGYDWNAYMTYFNRIQETTVFSKMEIGYGILNYFFYVVFDNYSLMNLSINLICTIILFSFCKKYSPFPITSLLFYAGAGGFFFSYNMGLTRQYIALSISLMTVHYIFKGKTLYAIFMLIIAFLFHKSAIITVLYFFCYKIELKKWMRLIIVFITIFLTLWGNSFIRESLSLFFEIPFLPNFILKYKPYIHHSIWGFQAEFSSGLGYMAVFLMMCTVFLLHENNSNITNFMLNGALLGLFIAAFGKNINIIGRLAKYFDIFNMFIFIYLVQIIRAKSKSVLFPVIFMIMLLYCVLIPYKFTKSISPVDGTPNWTMFSPWQTFLYPIENIERNERMQRINQFK